MISPHGRAVLVGSYMKKLMLILGLLLMTVSACAGQATAFYLEGFNYGSPTDWQNGYPYYAKIGNDRNPTVYVMCDAYIFAGTPGYYWQVLETNLGNLSTSLSCSSRTCLTS
jgi:hypothetical protein